jgi:gas vesicle protein
MAEEKKVNVEAIEAQVLSLASSVSKLEENFASFQNEVRGAITDLAKASTEQIRRQQEYHHKELDDVHSRITEGREAARLPFGQLISAGTLVLMIVGAVGTLAIAPINSATLRNSEHLYTLSDQSNRAEIVAMTTSQSIQSLTASQSHFNEMLTNGLERVIDLSKERHEDQDEELIEMRDWSRRIEERIDTLHDKHD